MNQHQSKNNNVDRKIKSKKQINSKKKMKLLNKNVDIYKVISFII